MQTNISYTGMSITWEERNLSLRSFVNAIFNLKQSRMKWNSSQLQQKLNFMLSKFVVFISLFISSFSVAFTNTSAGCTQSCNYHNNRLSRKSLTERQFPLPTWVACL